MKVNEFLNLTRHKRDAVWGNFLDRTVPQLITPDLLCVLKIPLAVFMLALIYYEIPYLVTTLFALWLFGKFIDILDGSLARVRKKTTDYGLILDGSTDRVILIVLLYGVWLSFPELSAFLYGIYFILLLFVTDMVRWRQWYRKKSSKTNFWQNWGDLIEISFRALMCAAALVQYLVFY